MDFTTICVGIIAIYVMIACPPLAIVIMLLAIEKIGLAPIIIYAIVIGIVYYIKHNYIRE